MLGLFSKTLEKASSKTNVLLNLDKLFLKTPKLP